MIYAFAFDRWEFAEMSRYEIPPEVSMLLTTIYTKVLVQTNART